MHKPASMIEVENLSKRFDQTIAVKNLSFTVEEGEVFVLLGTSGCGKTTTLKMINRLLEPDEGEVRINGSDIREQAPEMLRRRIGYVMQDTGLFPHYNIEENISIVPRLLKWDKAKTHARAEILLRKFNLPPDTYLPLPPNQLSGGQRQRVGFARALMADPPVILMDEPLGSLDPITRHQIQKEFKQLDELSGKTIILVTHDIPEAFELGDRICLMDHGEAQQTGKPSELLMHPRNDFVKHFFSNDQFVLQLKALRLKDLLPYLKPGHPPSPVHFLSEEADILDTIQALSDQQTHKAGNGIIDKNKNYYYPLDLDVLFLAFHQRINASGQ